MPRAGSRVRKQFFLDPLVYIGFFVLLELVMQFFNCGRVLYFDPHLFQWTYSQPGCGWLPSAVAKIDVIEYFAWFFPAVVLSMSIRYELNPAQRWLLLVAMLVNAAVLSVVGIVQRMVGANLFFDAASLPGDFFASFSYSNHAASFFLFMQVCCSAVLVLCVKSLSRIWLNRKRLWLMLWLAFFGMILCSLAASLCFSRAGVLLSWPFLVAVGLWVLVYFFRRGTALLRLNLVVFFVLFVCLLTLGFWSYWERGIGALLESICSVPFQDEMEGRSRLWLAAVRIWQDAPVWGAGAWGFRYFLPIEVGQSGVHMTNGAANVHCDALQILCEFGLSGMSLILTAVVAFFAAGVRFVLRDVRHRFPAGALRTILLLACCFTLLHSVIDLPFRCPAMMYAWFAVLTLAGVEIDDPVSLWIAAQGTKRSGRKSERME